MKAIKWLLYGVGGLVVLALLAVGAAFVIVDGAFVKSRMVTAMKERGRTLAIEGEPKFSLFPTLRLGLGKTTLTEANSDKAFASLDSLQVGVRVLPLLSGEVAVEALALSGLRLNIVRRADGRFNFDDLAAGKPAAAPAGPSEPVRLRIAEVSIERTQIAYTDQARGQTLLVSDLNIKTGRLEDDTPTPVTVSASISGKRPEVAIKAQLAASARMNLARQSFAFSKMDAKVSGNAGTLRGLDLRLTGDLAADARRQEYTVDALALQLKGMLEREALSASLSAPRLRIASSKAEGQAVAGAFSLKGPQRNVEARLSMAAVEGSSSNLTVPSFALDFSGQIGSNALKGQLATPIKANLKDGIWELPKVAGNLSLGRPDSALKAQLAGAAIVNAARQMVAVRGLDATATGSYESLRGLDLRLTGDVAADAQKREYSADKVVLHAKGTLDRDVFAASFEAPRLRVTPSKAEGQAVTGAVTVKGPQRDIDAKLNIAAVEGSANSLSIPSLKLDLASNLSGNGIKGTVSTPVLANL
ncbi:MAG: AsmA family protein, partial [Burkholderiales bacterium]|nr:AsmA family protein [Burkholderiales bacterium]